jgi:hypothetical protein
MLPPGLAAQPVSPAEAAAVRELHPAAQTVAALLVGGCACDLVRRRDPDPREDERHLRSRYSRLGLGRDEIIRRLERHRRRPGRVSPEPWAPQLAAFVAEHARNAGTTLYALSFADRGPAPPDLALVTRTAAQVRERPEAWLEEDRPVLVVR